MFNNKTKDGYEYSPLYCGFAKIYTLSDKNGNVFYVGCTTKPVAFRLSAHIAEARKWKISSNKIKGQKIAGLNFEIIATVVDVKWFTYCYPKIHTWNKVKDWEKGWIKKYMDLGYNLCNREARKKVATAYAPEFVGQTFTTKGDKIITGTETLKQSA